MDGVYRVMRHDDDGGPTAGNSGDNLGVRSASDETHVSPDVHLAAYARLLLQLHDLQAKQRSEPQRADAPNDEIDNLSDRMTAVWYGLSPDEMELAGMMSADLDMLLGDEVYRDVPSEQRTAAWFQQRFNDLWLREDWIEVLRGLRTGPEPLRNHPGYLAHFRGRGYDALGFPEVAYRFFDYAAR